MIKALTTALLEKQFLQAAELFDEDGVYIDYCPMLVGGKNWFLYGKGHIEMFLRNRLGFGSFSIFDPIAEDETNANYYACYDGVYVPVRMSIELRDGKITRAVVRPK